LLRNNAQYFEKEMPRTGCWWFMPVILVTWEAEIGRMGVPGQPR
jgi:hypothetical protein